MNEKLKTLLIRGVIQFVLELITALWAVCLTMILSELFGNSIGIILLATTINIVIAWTVNHFGIKYVDQWFRYFD